ncbi:MAG: homoserine kinase [Pseudomonadales bacterium]|nr:homoserine kinase [Pseudomonadales bacterium]
MADLGLMSVFTQVTPERVSSWLQLYQVGEFTSLLPISGGVQNSNYFLETSSGSWVLTLFESLDVADVQVYLDLMQRLHAAGMPVPLPCPQIDGRLFSSLVSKPAALVQRCHGKSLEEVDVKAVSQVGKCLATLHGLMQDWPGPMNPRGRAWRLATARQVIPRLRSDDVDLISWALQEDLSLPWQDLPVGGIHADLFRDNMLWQEGHISAVLDFYVAGRDAWAYDLAVCIHDWCRFVDGRLDVSRASALLKAYHAVRPLKDAEFEAWPSLLVVSALRFYLSRCFAFVQHVDEKNVLRKDPEEFRLVLNCMRANEWHESTYSLQNLIN